jgi:uncharacterized protein YjbJ (UPF0337 family)
MSDESRDRIEGFAQENKGKAKEAFGDLTGDENTQAEGETDQAMGNLKKSVADAKDKLGDMVKKATD